uniref:Uncharacterized protein n=1 Tax=Clastoptera arizonana TaxID=38151 RepID=A0A1B6CPU1_9HEMI
MIIVWKYVLFLIWLSYILICGVLLFMRGFLLNREVLPFNSTCKTHSSQSYCNIFHKPSDIKGEQVLECTEENFLSRQLNNKIDSTQYCLKTKTKLIVLVIDALKYDFMTYLNTPNNNESKVLAYQNNMLVINDILKAFPHNSRLYKFIADPPTTTMQRLKGITTGSLPTFIDIGSNFDTNEINEDNLIDQLIKQNKKIIFMGDDTWVKLYPNRFIRQFSFPSFNTWDLDSVDNGIKKHLLPEIKKDDWDIVIAHFLGVDHCGHRYGPLHKEMKRKLKEMNDIISDVVSQMGENTILLIIGDHGMTNSGDHGGGSIDEITAAMFTYFPNQTLISEPTEFDSVRQVDLVPTIATILGVPIPYSNVGCLILNALPALKTTSDLVGNWEIVVMSLWSNVKQVTLYLQEYSKTNQQFPQAKFKKLLKEFQSLKVKVANMTTEEQLKDFVLSSKNYLVLVREMCEDVWVQFDSFSISRGLVLVFLTLALIFLLIEGIPFDKVKTLLEGRFLSYAYGSILLSIITAYILVYLQFNIKKELTIYFNSCTSAIAILSVLIVHHWGLICANWYNLSKAKNNLNIYSRIIFLISAVGLFSNSYVVEESSVVSFLLISILWASITDVKLEYQKKSTKKSYFSWNDLLYSLPAKLFFLILLLTILLRFSWKYRRCREEQNCKIEKLMISNSSQCLLTIVSIAAFITSVRLCLRSFGNLVGFSPTLFISRYAPTVIVICTSGFWILHSLPRQTQYKLIEPWQLQILPRTAFSLIISGIIILFIRPLSIYHVTEQNEPIPQNNVIPALFKQLKGLLLRRMGSDVKGYPIVFGLATVYSATFINLCIFLTLLTNILLSERTAFISIVLSFSLFCIAIISAIIRQNKSVTTNQLFIVPWWSVICWGLSSLHFFYTSGHQATFSSLDWNSAFILSSNGQLESYWISALLVIGNTFCSYIVHAFMLPLLVIMPFTMHALFPKIGETKHAELLLFENDDLMNSSLFVLAIKFILFFGFRVFTCMLSASVHSRHLMVWAIFAPKLIFEVLSFFIILPCVLLGFILVQRITSRLENLLKTIQK